MARCEWREKPGSDPVCKVMPNAGEDLCPRHRFMTGVREENQRKKELKAAVERKLVKQNPKNRRELLEQGFQPVGNGNCNMCGAAIQWFKTPNNHRAPYEVMPDLDSPALSHFATCPYEKQFRRAS